MTDGFNRELGARIKRYRVLRGLTQSDLGEAIGVSFQQLQKQESGANRISAEQLVKLAAALELSPMDLLLDVPGEALGPELRRQDLVLYSALSKCSVRQKRVIAEMLEAFL
jgi:transcriptional regulator with XRE-family HTH domain